MNYSRRFFILLVSILTLQSVGAKAIKLSGYITDQQTRKPIPDANISIEQSKRGTVSHQNGYYEIEVQPGSYTLRIRVIGFEEVSKPVTLQDDRILDFNLEPRPVQLDRVCVTATRYNHLQSHVTVSSEIIPVSIMQGQTAGEQLTSVPGLVMKNHGGLAGASSPTLRGASNEQVLIMLDGIRLNTAQGTPLSLNNLPASALERIEVIRGGHSALMGSNALGGVINLVSKEPGGVHPFSANIQSTIGSFGTRIYSFSGSQQAGFLRTSLSLHKSHSDGNFSFKNPDTGENLSRQNNDFDSYDIFIKNQIHINRRHQVQFAYQLLSSKMGSPGPLYFGQSTARLSNHRNLISLQSDHQFSSNFHVKAKTYYNDIDRKYHDPMRGSKDRHQNNTIGLELMGQMKLLENITLDGGTAFHQDKIETTQYQPEKRKGSSLFCQSEFYLPFFVQSLPVHFKLIPAIRLDDYSDIGNYTSNKFGFLLSFGKNAPFIIRGNTGRSFRAPIFDEMYWNEYGEYYDYNGNLNRYSTLGNPDLKPEIGNNYDLGITLQHAADISYKIEANYFQNDIKNLIDWVTEYSEDYTVSESVVRNVSKAKITGFESILFLAMHENRYTVKLGHTHMKASDQNTGLKLPNRPESMFNLEFGLNLKFIHAMTRYSVTGKRFSDVANTSRLSGYSRLDGSLGTVLTVRQFKFNIAVQGINLLDKDIFFMDGYPLPGREFRLTLGLAY